jgi:hypothetical protein
MVEMAAVLAVAAEIPTASTEGAARRVDGLEASLPGAQASQVAQAVQAAQVAQVASEGALPPCLQVARAHEAVRAEQRAAGRPRAGAGSTRATPKPTP